MTQFRPGCGGCRHARPPHDLVHGLLHGALFAVPLWLVILKAFHLI